MRYLQALVIGVVVAWASLAPGLAAACPGCKEATSEQGQSLARGFSYSILFMMPIPFIIVGSFGGYAYYVTRQRLRDEQTASPTDDVAPPKADA